MSDTADRVRVLYSFPNKIGAERICYTAWQQVNSLAAAGADVVVYTGDLLRPLPQGVKVHRTLARGKFRIPYKLVGSHRALALHDWIVSRQVGKIANHVDVIHTWPLGACETLKKAQALGIPSVLERCNAPTGFAMEVVQKECDRLGVVLPRKHEHAFNAQKLRREEEEYRLATRLLCPSDFVVNTFLQKGYASSKLVRHMYGYDENVYYPNEKPREINRGLVMLFVGTCAVRKGLHYALESWLRSPASKEGTFLIAGTFLQAYEARLASMLAHPSIKVLGHRRDVPQLMRNSDILVLPTVEEGSALVTSEAKASGCVLLVSEAAGAVCTHLHDALVHCVGDVNTLTEHITMLHKDRALLERLRINGLASRHELTWTAAGVRLLQAYRETIVFQKRPQANPDGCMVS